MNGNRVYGDNIREAMNVREDKVRSPKSSIHMEGLLKILLVREILEIKALSEMLALSFMDYLLSFLDC